MLTELYSVFSQQRIERKKFSDLGRAVKLPASLALRTLDKHYST